MRKLVFPLTWIALLGATPLFAGALQGTVRIATPQAPIARVANAYPGRAGTLPTTSVLRGQAVDAVIYLDHYPAVADSAIARTRHVAPSLAQRQQSFVPRVLAVPVGAVVEFPNQDRIYHNVFSLSPTKRFDLGKYPLGQSRQVKFTKPGLVNVYCDIHSDMEAFILVVPTPGFARPRDDGSYGFPDLPAGKYHVKIWHPDYPELERDVEIPATGTVVCDFTY